MNATTPPNQSNYSKDTLLDKISAITGIAPTSDQTAKLAALFISEQIVSRSRLIDEIEAKLPESDERAFADQKIHRPDGWTLELQTYAMGFNTAITEVKAILEDYKNGK
jgi:hypothetical protein